MEEFDLFTFFAVILNFIVLVVLLRVFLYKRIIKAMDNRKNKIQQDWDEAEEAKQNAEEKLREAEKEKEALSDKREELISEAREEAEQKKKELIEEARKDVEENRRNWMQSLEQDKDRFLRKLKEKSAVQIVDTLKSIFEEMADSTLEERMIHTFLRRLEKDTEQKEHMAEYLNSSAATVTVKSSFELDEKQRDEIEKGLAEIKRGISLDFAVSEDLICGIELDTREYKIAWNIEDHLDNYAQTISGIIGSRKGPG
jgi:F-type H+-transporting ATPase subunit b